MMRMPSRLALSGMALVCAAILVACNCAPTLRYVSVSPSSGTIYISGGLGAGVKGAVRPAAHPASKTTRKASVSPRDITTAVCGSLQFSATSYYSDGTTQNASTTVTWTTSPTGVATVDNTGLATGVGLGTTSVGAVLNGVSATPAALEVDILTGITLSAPSNTLPFGAGQTYAAIGSFTLADESTVTQDISSQVTWNSSNPNVAAIDTSGNVTTGATGQTQGTTTITATSCDGFTVGSALLTVGASGPVSLQIMPANPTVAAGSTVTFTAVEVLSGGGTQPVTGTLSWSSDTTSVATINMTSGLAITVPGAGGTANISATETPAGSSNMISGTTVLTTTAAAARFAYVGNGSGLEGAGSISAYTVNAAAGSLTPFDSEFPASSPQQVLLHPSGHLMYYIDAASFLHVLDVDSVAGGLTDPGLAPRQAGSGGANVGVIDPTGRFIYVVDDGSNSGTPSIYGYSITQTTSSATNGTLAAIPGATPHTDSNLSSPSWVMTDNAGKYLYVVNSGSNWITEYSIDQTSGALTALPTPYITTGNAPLFGTTDINGFLYVANNGTVQSVSAYSITPGTGQLVSAGADTVITGATSTINVLAHPSGNFLYVVDQNSNALQPGQVFAFGLSPTTPTSVIGAVIPPGSSATTGYPTGLSPLGLAIDPTGIFMVVANNGDTPNDLSLIKIGADGSLAAPSGATTAPADSNAQFPVFYNFASGQ